METAEVLDEALDMCKLLIDTCGCMGLVQWVHESVVTELTLTLLFLSHIARDGLFGHTGARLNW